MKSRIIFVTGTDTGVGKTVFATLLVRHLCQRGRQVVGLKPFCSGDRGDAEALRQAAGSVLPLDEVNPWHFRAALAPLLAARQEKRRVQLRQVVARIRRLAKKYDRLVVEGAGGLLSPLGAGFDSRDLLRALDALPIVVCADRLGAVNQTLLVLEAMPRKFARRAQIILSAVQPDASSATNATLLRELIGGARVHQLPRVRPGAPISPHLRQTLVRITA